MVVLLAPAEACSAAWSNNQSQPEPPTTVGGALELVGGAGEKEEGHQVLSSILELPEIDFFVRGHFWYWFGSRGFNIFA